MSKFLYPIYKLKTKSYIKWWLYHKKAGGLPKEYQRINYIRAETTAYIDSLIKVDNTFEINFKCKFLNFPADLSYNENAIMSNWIQSINYWNFFIRGSARYFDFYAKAHNMLEICELNKDYNISIKQKNNDFSVKINNNHYNFSMYGALLSNPTTIKFLARGDGVNNNTDGNCLGNIVIKNEQNKIVGNFIPCKRKKDNVIGMYDTITEKFFTKNGSGNLMEVD